MVRLVSVRLLGRVRASSLVRRWQHLLREKHVLSRSYRATAEAQGLQGALRPPPPCGPAVSWARTRH